ncbi:hypothetical protein C8F01DRAFT_1153102 [Mycena amicta]|nr:hypothetical protein C8F01DRAFT_1153102 [Mycena amicta]
MSSDDPYSPRYGTATFTDLSTMTRPDSPDDSYTDSNSLEEVEATLNDLEDEMDDTENAVSAWTSSYTGSPSFVSLPSFASPPPLPQHTRLSKISERTEEATVQSRPSSMATRPPPSPEMRRSVFAPSAHSRASTDPGLPPPGRATELIAVFESSPGHSRTTSTPGPSARSPSPFFTPAHSISELSSTATHAQGFYSTFGSRPASPTKSSRVTSPPVPTTPSRTRPSMSTLLSQPPLSTSGRASPSAFSRTTDTRTDTYTDTYTNTRTDTYTTRTDTFTPSNTYPQTTSSYNDTQSRTTTTTPPSLRRPPQGSPRSPLASVRNIVALWKERTPTRPGGNSPSASSSDKTSSKSSEHPLPPLPADQPSSEDLFAIRRLADDAASLRSGRSPSLRSARSGANPPSLNIAELNQYAQSNEPPLHIGLLWFLNVHAPPPYRWQRCQALLYSNLLLLSWIAPGGGRGVVGLDLVNCTAVQSMPSPGHPSARDDVGSVAARLQSEAGEPGVDTLVDLLVPFQMIYEDGVERLAAESLLERQKWVNRIWEAVHRPPTGDESSAGSSAGDADESGSARSSKIARSESIRTILSIDSADSHRSASSNGSRSTVFLPPIADIPDISSGESSTSSSRGYRRGTGTYTPSEAWTRTFTPTGTRTGTFTPTRTETYTTDYSRTYTPTDVDTQTQTETTGVRRQPSLVSSHHTGTVDDSVITGGEYVYPGDPRVIVGHRRGLGARRGSMGQLDEEYHRSSGSSDDVFLSADSQSRSSASSASASRTSASGTSYTPQRSGTLYSSNTVGLRTGTGTFSLTASPSRTGGPFSIGPSSLSYRGPGSASASMREDSQSDYSGSDVQSDSYSSYSYSSASGLTGTGSPRTISSLARAREVRRLSRRPGLGLVGGPRSSSSGYTYSSSYSYSSEEDKENTNSSSGTEDREPSDTNENGSGTATGSGATPATYSTNQTGYDICDSSDLSDVTIRTRSSGETPPSSSSSSSSSTLPYSPPSTSGSSDQFITASQGSSSESEYTTARRAPSSHSSYESFPTIPSESRYQTASEPSEYGDIPSEMGTPRPTPSVLPSEEGDEEKQSLHRVPSLVPTIRSEVTDDTVYPPLPPSTVSDRDYPPLPPSSIASSEYPPLPPSSVASSEDTVYPALPPSTASVSDFPPLPPSSLSSESSLSVSLPRSEHYPPLPSSVSTELPPLPSSTEDSIRDSDVSSISYSEDSSFKMPSSFHSTEDSSDVATPMSLELSSASSEPFSGPSPIESSAPSTPYDWPSSLSKSSSDTSSVTSSSNLTPLVRALSNLRSSWSSARSSSDRSYESSILGPSPSVGSIALPDAPDISGETSFLRPTASFSSFDRLSTIPRSPTSIATLPLPPPSSSLSDVSSPSSLGLPSGSTSLGRSLSLLTQSSMLSDSSLPDTETEEEPFEELTTSLVSTTPRPSRPPSSIAASSRSLRTPDASGSVSISTPRGNMPSVRSLLETVPPEGEPSTQGVTLEYLADELHRLADARGVENQEISGNVRSLRNELRDLANYLHRPASEISDMPSPMMPAPPSPVAAAPSQPTFHYLDPPPSQPPSEAASSLRRWPSSATTMSYLSSHYSDDDMPSPYPDSPYPNALPDIEEESRAGSPMRHSRPSTPREELPQMTGRPFQPDSPPSSSSSSSSSSSAPTVRPPPDLGDLRDAINRLSDAAASHGRLLDEVRGTVDQIPLAPDYRALLNDLKGRVDALGEGQTSTNHMLDRLREGQPDAALHDRLRRIEDILQSLVDQPREPPRPFTILEDPGSDYTSSDGSSLSIVPRERPEGPSAPLQPVPTTAPARTFAEQLDDLLSNADSAGPPQPAERPPAIHPFIYEVEGRGLRPRSELDLDRPITAPPTHPIGADLFANLRRRTRPQEQPPAPITTQTPAPTTPQPPPHDEDEEPASPGETETVITEQPGFGQTPRQFPDTRPRELFYYWRKNVFLTMILARRTPPVPQPVFVSP